MLKSNLCNRREKLQFMAIKKLKKLLVRKLSPKEAMFEDMMESMGFKFVTVGAVKIRPFKRKKKK